MFLTKQQQQQKTKTKTKNKMLSIFQWWFRDGDMFTRNM